MHLEEILIVDYVDGALDAAARERADRHLAACEACRLLIEDLQEIRRAAAALPLRTPPARAWTRLERAISVQNAHGIQRAPGKSWSALRLRQSTRGWLAAAAVLIVATIAGIRYGRVLIPGATVPQSTVQRDAGTVPGASAAAVEAELRAAESHYSQAIRGLEEITRTERGVLDPGTAATLQKGLAVIDQAISESRAAVVAQPTSEPARESLLESFRTKLALLQDTVALINEMRKGDEAGAARVVSGLKQKG